MEDLEDYQDLLQLFDNFSVDSVTKAFPGAPSDKRVHKYFKAWVDSISKYALRDSMVEYFSSTVDIVEVDGDLFDLAHYPNDWGKAPIFNDEQHALEFIRAPEAWEISTGDNEIIIAIINEAPAAHEDLDANIAYKSPNILPATSSYHGTKVAGGAAAVTNNHTGLSSIGYNSKLWCQNLSDVYDDLIGAVVNGARVFNITMMTHNPLDYVISHQELYYDLYDDGIFVLAGAGNGPCWEVGNFCYKPNTPCDELVAACTTSCDKNEPGDQLAIVGSGECLIYPASYDKVISVSSVGHINDIGWQDPNDQREYFWKDVHLAEIGVPEMRHTSNDSVDLCAPGWHVETTFHYNDYSHFYGTSIATPIVAGIAALMIDVRQCLSPEEIEWILKRTAVNVDYVYHNNVNLNEPYIGKLGAGRVDAYEALKWVDDGLSFEIKEGENVTWEATRRISGKVVIKPEGRLTIKGTVLFAGDGQIIIERGGRLVIDGGILTYGVTKVSGCPEVGFWKGIEVHGHSDIPHSALIAAQALSGSYPTDEDDHGVVIVKNGARIENAYVGIRNAKIESWGFNQEYSGGIILVEDATFVNCWKSVEMWRFRPDQDGSATSTTNVSRFYNTEFITTDDWPDPLKLPQAFVTMWENHNVVFRQCQFENEDYQHYDLEKRGKGIVVADATFQAVPFCTEWDSPSLPANCLEWEGNRFKNLYKGIDLLYAMQQPAVAVVERAEFDGNKTGIQLSGPGNNVEVVLSDFKLPNTSGEIYGIATQGAHGFKIEQNTFSQASSPSNTFLSAGIRIKENGWWPNKVYKNTFENIANGVWTEGDNRGFEIKCNKFISPVHFHDVLVCEGPGVRLHQGFCLDDMQQGYEAAPAGNIFSRPVYTLQGDWKDESTPDHQRVVQYHHHNTTDPTSQLILVYYSSGKIVNRNCEYTDFNEEAACPSTIITKPEVPQTISTMRTMIGWVDSELGGSISQAYEEWLHDEREWLVSEATRTFLKDDSLYGVDSAIAFLAADTNIFAQASLIPLLIQKKDYSSAEQVLEGIGASKYDTAHLVVYYEGLLGILNGGNNLHTLDSAEVAALEAIAADTTKYAIAAQTALHIHSGQDLPYPSTYCEPEMPTEGKQDGEELTYKKTPGLQIFPNPANTLVTLKWTSNDNPAKVRITDLQGKDVWFAEAVNSNLVTVSTASWPQGFYLVRWQQEGHTIVRHLVIIR